MTDEEYFPYKDEGYRILGAAFEVYRRIGNGFGEGVYQEALAIEFSLRDIPFEEQPRLHIEYKGTQLRRTFVPDFICFDAIIVEIKAVALINDLHRSQLFNYLKASRFILGYVLNFGHEPLLEHDRKLCTW
jgi:GxxExxY protein